MPDRGRGKTHKHLNTINACLRRSDHHAAGDIVPFLKVPDPVVRAAAASALGKLGNPSVIHEIADLLVDNDPEVRHAAIQALGWLADPAVIPYLSQMLQVQDDDTRLQIVMALGWIEDIHVIPGLISALEDPDRSVRRAAFGWLLDKQEMAIPYLIRASHDANRNTSLSAVVALQLIGEYAVNDLVAAFLEGEYALSQHISRVLVSIGEPAVKALSRHLAEPSHYDPICDISSRIGEPAFVYLAQLSADQTIEQDIREAAAKAVAAHRRDVLAPPFPSPQSPGITDHLLVRLHNGDSEDFEAVREELDKIDADIVPELLARLSSADRASYISAAWALGVIGDQHAVLGLLRTLRHEDWLMRWVSAQALGILGSANAVPALLKSLFDPDSGVKIAAAEALGKIGEPAAIGLVQALREKQPEIRWAAAVGLAAFNRQDVPALLKIWRSAENDNRWAIARALDRIAQTRVGSDIPDSLLDEITSVYDSAAENKQESRGA